ncbi:hypothetical protein [Cupriavidus sp. IDO]|uniref:hypothetical protein n=1 Tax=Cupriavidus sp. IDO TaxID=1539142 RepID=UPI000578FB41|nr:hypothetical protein [Cupriavidus sp. IDO]KWR90537.1 hypothetical protein RM96_08845 [Cupriavidus sp. IDO]
MKHLRLSHLILAAAVSVAAVPVFAQTTQAPRDPYSQGARTGDKFDPYTQGANATTRQDLAPAPADPAMQPQGTVSNDPLIQRRVDRYNDATRWEGPFLGTRLGPRSNFLDGA